MTRKNYLIIFGSILFIIILVLILYFILAKKKGDQKSQLTNQNSVTLPTETKINPQNVQSVQKAIESTMQKPIPSQVSQNGSEFIELNDQNKSPIPLPDFEKATGITINKQLRNYLDNNIYDLFYCPGENNEKDFGIYLSYDAQKAYADLFPDTVMRMKEWEKTMLPDLHAVLFPNVNFSESGLGQNLQFRDGKFRYAEIQLPDGKLSSINYDVFGDGVLISASPSCLDNMILIYEPLQP